MSIDFFSFLHFFIRSIFELCFRHRAKCHSFDWILTYLYSLRYVIYLCSNLSQIALKTDPSIYLSSYLSLRISRSLRWRRFKADSKKKTFFYRSTSLFLSLSLSYEFSVSTELDCRTTNIFDYFSTHDRPIYRDLKQTDRSYVTQNVTYILTEKDERVVQMVAVFSSKTLNDSVIRRNPYLDIDGHRIVRRDIFEETKRFG